MKDTKQQTIKILHAHSLTTELDKIHDILISGDTLLPGSRVVWNGITFNFSTSFTSSSLFDLRFEVNGCYIQLTYKPSFKLFSVIVIIDGGFSGERLLVDGTEDDLRNMLSVMQLKEL